MKRIFLILLFAVCFIPFQVLAVEDYHNFTYSIDEENQTIKITKYNGTSEEVVIPSSVTMNEKNYSVVLNGGVFYNNTAIKKVVFESGVKAGDTLRRLFRGCSSLESVDFSDFDTSSTTTLTQMFYNATSLKEVNMSHFNTSNVTDFSYLFYNCFAIKNLDLSSFDTKNGISMQYMFYRCNSLEYLNIQGFDTTQATNFQVGFGFDSIKTFHTIVVGKNFRIQNNYGNSFGRGTWVREEDGKHVDAVDVPFLEDSSGTYHKLTDTVDNLSNLKAVTYRISPNISKIDSFRTNNPEQFEVIDNKYLIVNHLTVQSTDNYVVPGNAELLFQDAVTDSNGNSYDLSLLIDNVHLYDLNVDAGVTDFVADIVQILTYENSSGIGLYNYFYPTVDDLRNGTGNFYKTSSIFEDVTMRVLNKNGEAVEGDYLFSAYDIDGASVRDINSSHLNIGGTAGYGEFSEGVTLGEGFDMSTLWMHDHTFLIQPRESRITGSRSDNSSELSEFVIVSDAKYSKFTWNGSGNVGSAIFYRYQPQVMHFEYLNQKSQLLSGVKLSLYNDRGDLVKEWTTEKETKNLLLNPGRYVLRQTSTLNGYTKVDDVEFYVDFEGSTNHENSHTIQMISDYQLTVNPKTGSRFIFFLFFNSLIVLFVMWYRRRQKLV